VLELVLVGLAVLVGLVGIVMPVLPGSILVFAAITVWALLERTGPAWLVLAITVLAIGAAQVLKYVLPERSLRAHGIPARTTLIGVAAGIVGFFVGPVVGMPLGFVAGVFGSELARHRAAGPAWASTRRSLVATGVSILIELAGASVAATDWFATLQFA
jgi:uncharacterized protein YqgC (DUF456 family)